MDCGAQCGMSSVFQGAATHFDHRPKHEIRRRDGMPLATALRLRRSVRGFAPDPLSLRREGQRHVGIDRPTAVRPLARLGVTPNAIIATRVERTARFLENPSRLLVHSLYGERFIYQNRFP